MSLTAWLVVVSICCLGAMSPGPSLGVVLKHTLNGGRKQGLIAALSHGAGVGLYAFACISGLAVLITTSELAFATLQWLGAAYLVWLGIKGLRSKGNSGDSTLQSVTTNEAVRDGFLIVFLNPKIAVFFIALFAQVIGDETSWLAKMVYASTAMIIDGLWYVIVAWLFSNPKLLHHLQRNAIWFDRLFGAVLIALASRLVIDLLR